MEISEIGWIIGLHVAMSVWLGLLASTWKGRSAWTWFATGLLTSVVGLVLLARLEKRTPAKRQGESDMQLQYMDGTSMIR